MTEINQIYDKAFKRILTLSRQSVINLINGLFDKDYSTNSEITYNWTEFEDKELNRTLADSIVTINGTDSYHMEAQMTKDEEIVFRVFEYGYGHAQKNRIIGDAGERLIFPQPCIIYLDEGKKDKVPDEYTLTLEFRGQGTFDYKVPVVKLQNMKAQELDDKKLFVLLPFLLLRVRKKIAKVRSKENMDELKTLLLDDIIGLINRNEEVGNLTASDAMNLRDLTLKLYKAIYLKYTELEDLTMWLYDQSFELFTDKFEKTVEELQEEVAEMRDTIEQKDARIRELEELLREAKK